GKLSVQEIYSRAESLSLDLYAENYNFIIFNLKAGDGSSYSEPAEMILEKILGYFLRFPEFILFHCNLRSYAVLIKGGADEIGKLTEQCVNTISEYCTGAEIKIDWHIAVGTPTNRLSGLSKCYSDVNHILAYRYMLPERHILTSEILTAEKDGLFDKSAGYDVNKIDPMVLRNFAENGLAEETEPFVRGFMSNLGGAENSLMFRNYLIMSARVSAELALNRFGINKDEIDSTLPQPDFTMSTENVEPVLVNILRSAIELRNRNSMEKNNDIINQAISYISDNFCDENISLNSVAKELNISSNYFSALFSARMGMSFVEYLTEKRMEKAKHLLLRTNMRSGEIANEVGYHDPRYFSFVFRKTQGVTPSAFRNNEVEE
ncbi:MAG: AraC family transcriptional regulator, partial [Clostridia bacterium]|nr:AraC family transcriptional regulator [Clostridia bacterium]